MDLFDKNKSNADAVALLYSIAVSGANLCIKRKWGMMPWLPACPSHRWKTIKLTFCAKKSIFWHVILKPWLDFLFCQMLKQCTLHYRTQLEITANQIMYGDLKKVKKITNYIFWHSKTEEASYRNRGIPVVQKIWKIKNYVFPTALCNGT